MEPKNAMKQRAALRRWSGQERRVVRLSELRPEEADVVRALLRLKAARDAQEKAPEAVEMPSEAVSAATVADDSEHTPRPTRGRASAAA